MEKVALEAGLERGLNASWLHKVVDIPSGSLVTSVDRGGLAVCIISYFIN